MDMTHLPILFIREQMSDGTVKSYQRYGAEGAAEPHHFEASLAPSPFPYRLYRGLFKNLFISMRLRLQQEK
jgi:hypothetical protein